jgi:drug/metabolite transporter (DMT)-like permease
MHALTWMSGALVSFCLMAIGARELSSALPVFQTLFFRSVIGLMCLSLIALLSTHQFNRRSEKVSLHIFRNAFHFTGQYAWFLAIGLLPLAEVFALEFTVPIWTLIIAAIFLGEQITKRKIVAVLIGMIGVLIIVQPGYALFNWASFIVLGSAICFAISNSATKSLSASESPLSILFYMCLTQLPIALCLSLGQWVWPDMLQSLWLTLIGLMALSAHYCMIKAMKHTEITRIVTLDFFRLPLIALVGIFLYGEQLQAPLMVGAALMLVANLVSIKRKNAQHSATDMANDLGIDQGGNINAPPTLNKLS